MKRTITEVKKSVKMFYQRQKNYYEKYNLQKQWKLMHERKPKNIDYLEKPLEKCLCH